MVVKVFLSKMDNIYSLLCGLATYLIAVCKDTTVKMGGRKCVFFNIWSINVKHSMERKDE